jgi:hypothetical protein
LEVYLAFVSGICSVPLCMIPAAWQQRRLLWRFMTVVDSL